MSGLPERTRLVLVTLAFCLLGVAYSVSLPLFEAPDEVWHVSFVRVLAEQRSLPVQPTEDKDIWLREAGQPPLYYLTAAPVAALLDTSDFPDLVRFNVAHPAITPGVRSEATNLFIHTRRERFPYQGAVLAVHTLRLLSVVWGAGTVIGAYLVARETLPARPGLAVVAAALTAFNPHFILISSVVNNDACAACLCTLVLWRSIRLVEPESPFELTQALALGLLLGLALLTKLSALALLPLVALALALRWWRDRDWRGLLRRGAATLSLAGLVGGWWYGRNWVLYGDPLAWNVWLLDLAHVPIGPVELVRQFDHVATSFWEPYDGLFPPLVFWLLGLLTVLAAAGWIRLIGRLVRRDRRVTASPQGLLLSGVWFLLLFASLVRYMLTTPSDEGRLLFPGIAALALLFVLGIETLLPHPWQHRAFALTTMALLVLSISAPCYALPRWFPSPLLDSAQDIQRDVPADGATYTPVAHLVEAAHVRLLGIQVNPDYAQPGTPVQVILYWEALGSPPEDLRAVVQLWTVGGRLVSHRDATAASATYPPDLWQAGDVVRDVYRMELHERRPVLCRVTIGVQAGGELLAEITSPPMLRLAGDPISPAEIPHPVSYTLGDQVALIGYDSAPSGETLTATLYWRALAEPDEAYTVFLHLVDEEGRLLGQGDGLPLEGDYPTSHWSPGEVLPDTHPITLDSGSPADARWLLVGLYRPADGSRLPVHTASGERVPDDAIRLDTYAR